MSRFTLVDPSRPTAALGNDPAAPRPHASGDAALPGGRRGGRGAETERHPAATGTFPLVVFAHGFNISAAATTTSLRDLAAQGFVVAAPDFPLSSTSPPGPVTQDDIDNQARDVVVPRRELLGRRCRAPGRGARARRGRPRPASSATRTAAATAARVATNSCCFDGRIGAAVILSGDEGQSGGAWAVAGSPPMLLLQGTADTINPWSLSQRLYDDAAAPKWLVAINGADHLTPYTSGPQRGAIVALVAEFLRATAGSVAAVERAGRRQSRRPVVGRLGLSCGSRAYSRPVTTVFERRRAVTRMTHSAGADGEHWSRHARADGPHPGARQVGRLPARAAPRDACASSRVTRTSTRPVTIPIVGTELAVGWFEDFVAEFREPVLTDVDAQLVTVCPPIMTEVVERRPPRIQRAYVEGASCGACSGSWSTARAGKPTPTSAT